jgi:dTDP-4-amino-4,6-dideoxygalactose transaminase
MAVLALKGGKKVADGVQWPAWPIVDDEDRKAVLGALDSRSWCCLFANSRVKAFEEAYAKFHDAKHAIAAANGTVSIELALIAAGVLPGDEVLVPAVTFIASASAIACAGAIPIFVDCDPETYQISPTALATAVTRRTKAIVAVHYGGYPVDFDAILPIVKKHNLVLIEDCAHAHGTEWKGRKVGAIGTAGSFSFQASKSLTAGEGGVVLTDDPALAEKARLLHNIGRVPGKPGYEHYVLSSNYRMTEFQGALLLSQMRRLREQTDKKHENGLFLAEGLRQIGGLEPLKADPRITKRGYYFFIARYSAEAFKGLPPDKFRAALSAEGIPNGNGYAIPLYKQVAFKEQNVTPLLPRKLGPRPKYEKIFLPNAERICSEQVTIAHTMLLAERQQIQLILDAVEKIKKHSDELMTRA